MERVWDWLLDWVDRLRMLWKLFSGAMLIHTGLGIRRADAKSITIAHKNNKKWRPRHSRSRIMTPIDSYMLHWLIDWLMIDEWWLRRDGGVSLVLMGDKCSDVGWILMFVCGVTCTWRVFWRRVRSWLAGRLGWRAGFSVVQWCLLPWSSMATCHQ